MAGVPVAGAGILQAIEAWIWPSRGNPSFMFKWPYEQNALTHAVFNAYPSRYTLLKPGCPINSPFGAFFRHLVGGTPHRAVYHPDHRLAWLVGALRCTLRGLATNGTADDFGARCTPNEPRLLMNTTGCVDSRAIHDHRPVRPTVRARVRASDWEACCAYCNADAACMAWSFAWQWKPTLRNCWLISATEGAEYAKGFVLALKAGTSGTATAQQNVRQGTTSRAFRVPPPADGGLGAVQAAAGNDGPRR